MTSSTSKRSPGPEALNAICPYYTMFPLAFPVRALSRVEAGTWVLDPFCGRGSTNFAARILGLPTVGIDSNPVAAAIAEGKLGNVTPDGVVVECEAILASTAVAEQPTGEFWSRCYESETFRELCALRSALLLDASTPTRKALRSLLLGLLHGPRNKGAPSYLSNQMPRTYASKPDYAVRYWESRNLDPVRVSVLDLVRRKAHYYFSNQPSPVPFAIVRGDSRVFDLSSLGVRFSAVVTSPPYYGMRTYVPDQWLRYWFLGGPAEVTYRHSTQMSHGSADDFSAQLSAVWSNVARACEPGAKLVVRFGGIHDRQSNAKQIMMASLNDLRSQFRVITVRSAGGASLGKRQAEQFRTRLKNPIEEFDFYITVLRPS